MENKSSNSVVFFITDSEADLENARPFKSMNVTAFPPYQLGQIIYLVDFSNDDFEDRNSYEVLKVSHVCHKRKIDKIIDIAFEMDVFVKFLETH